MVEMISAPTSNSIGSGTPRPMSDR